MNATYSQRGRLTFGKGALISLSLPFASLDADESAITVSCFGKCWTIPKGKILRLSKYRYFSDGLRVEHESAGNPKYIIFWTLRFDHLRRELENLGYVVV
jgi:hypothetical protein